MPDEPSQHEFDRALRQTRRAGGDGVYDLDLHNAWRVGGGLNGGFLLAQIGQALRATLAADLATPRVTCEMVVWQLTCLASGTSKRPETANAGRL